MNRPVRTGHPVHNLPSPHTAFINRTEELTALRALLADPSCRLLTLVGPGGIGKTRLAVEAVRRWVAPAEAQAPRRDQRPIQENPSANFPDGLFFVNLQPIRMAELLPAALAEAVRLSLNGQAEPTRQLLDYLADKALLLLLDNVEQLLPALNDQLLALLAAAPGVKLMVTSRTVLNLREEWVFPVPGLPYPQTAEWAATMDPARNVPADLMAYAAVRLFVEQAQRAQHTFELAEQAVGVVRICQLVEGIPLALELAAAWTKTLSCAAIADEIARNLEFLTTPLHNMPPQHSSLRAVFEQSWSLLTPAEQRVFRRLAIFRNGFQRAAATAVAGATLVTLTALVDQSLIVRKADDRYQIHELLRQYAEVQLLAAADEMVSTQEAHGLYYGEYLAQYTAAICDHRQQAAINAISADYENIRVAWQWLLAHGAVALIGRATFALNALYTFRSLYHEGVRVLAQSAPMLRALASSPDRDVALANVLVGLGWLQIRRGQLDAAQSSLEESQQLHTSAKLPPHPGLATDPLLGLGVLALARGNYAAATALGEAAQQRSLHYHHRANVPIALYILAQAAQAQGNAEAAARFAHQAYTATQATQDRWFMAYCLVTLGDIAVARNAYAAAAQHYQAAYELRTAFADPEGTGHALYRLAMVKLHLADYAAAAQLLERSLDLYATISDRGGRAWVLNGLGLAAVALGEPARAREHWTAALRIAVEIDYPPLLLDLCTNIAEALLRPTDPELALALLICARRHPACGRETAERARRLVDVWQTELPAALLARANQHGQTQELAALTTQLQSWLLVPTVPDQASTDATADANSLALVAHPARGCAADRDPTAQSLVEPLTERELDVLQLLAGGLSNGEIADQLVLAVGTVKFYTAQIYGKLGVRNRTQAVTRAQTLHLLETA